MRLGISTLITVLLLSASPTLAKQVTCEFNDYGGRILGESNPTEYDVIPFLGTGAVIATDTAQLTRFWPGKREDNWVQTKKTESTKFTTYTFSSIAEGMNKGKYSYRIYRSGTCRASVDLHFLPTGSNIRPAQKTHPHLTAKGKWK